MDSAAASWFEWKAESPMMSRIWHGYTTPADANAYEELLQSEIFTGIQNRRITGYRGIQLFRRNMDTEVEFMTVMWFDSFSQNYDVRAEMKKETGEENN